jgi:hypothetical protein
MSYNAYLYNISGIHHHGGLICLTTHTCITYQASTTTAALYVLHQGANIQWLQRAREEAIAANAADDVPVREHIL